MGRIKRNREVKYSMWIEQSEEDATNLSPWIIGYMFSYEVVWLSRVGQFI